MGEMGMAKKSISISLFNFIVLFVMGCSSTHCRRYHDLSDATKTKWVGATTEEKVKSVRVNVYKDDGSLQCGMGQAITLDIMKKELDGLEVFSMKNKPDGLMHLQACGRPTGQINVYEIRQVDVDQAIKKGFKLLPKEL